MLDMLAVFVIARVLAGRLRRRGYGPLWAAPAVFGWVIGSFGGTYLGVKVGWGLAALLPGLGAATLLAGLGAVLVLSLFPPRSAS